MAKLTLTDVANLQNESTVVTALKSNNDATEAALENTLSRDGTSPNQMLSNLDMNDYRIVNLPDAITDQEPATYSQVKDMVSAVDVGGVVDAQYVVLSASPSFTDERVLTAGTNISILDSGAGNNVTVAVSDAELNALASVTSASDALPYFTGAGTASTTTLTSYARTLLDDPDSTTALSTLNAQQHDADLDALAGTITTGLYSVIGSGTSATRTLTGPAAGITVTNGNGVSGNPTVALANDLSALEGLSSTGIARRTGTDAWSVGTAVSNSELATAAAFTIKGNSTGSSATPTDISIPSLTHKTTPAIADIIMISDSAASNALKFATISEIVAAASAASAFTTGDAKLTLKTTADTGWVMMNDGSIGSATSGATTRANSDTQNLYTLLWTNISDTWAPVSSGRGASAAADFAANKTLTLPRQLGRALAVSGSGSSLTARTLGSFLGSETNTLSTSNLPPYTPSGSVSTSTTGSIAGSTTAGSFTNQFEYGGGSSSSLSYTSSSSSSFTGNAQGGTSTPVNNMQPSSFWNVMLKL